MIGDWSREQENDRLLPKSKPKNRSKLSSLIERESREQDRLSLLPKSDSARSDICALLPKSESREQSREQSRELEQLLPNSEIREQLERGETILGKSMIKVKGTQYILSHSKSDKYMPELKGWLEIKTKNKISYLYIRWREGATQKSRCMGKLDRLS